MMTRKDYQRIAEVLAAEYAIMEDQPLQRLEVRNIIYGFADAFKQDDPQFDRDEFYQACKIRVYTDRRHLDYTRHENR